MKKNRTKHSPQGESHWRYTRRRQWRNYPAGTREPDLQMEAAAFGERHAGDSMREAELVQKIGELTSRFFITRSVDCDEVGRTPTLRCRSRWQCENRSSVFHEPVRAGWRGTRIDRRMDEEALSPDDTDTQSGGVGRQPQARANGAREHCAQAEHKQASAGTRRYPYLLKLTVSRINHATSHTSRWREASYTWWRSSLVFAAGARLALVQLGDDLLRGGSERSWHTVAQDIQHGPEPRRSSVLLALEIKMHGWQRSLYRQHLRSAAH